MADAITTSEHLRMDQLLRDVLEKIADCAAFLSPIRGKDGQIAAFGVAYLNAAAERHFADSALAPMISEQPLGCFNCQAERELFQALRQVAETGVTYCRARLLHSELCWATLCDCRNKPDFYHLRIVQANGGVIAFWSDQEERRTRPQAGTSSKENFLIELLDSLTDSFIAVDNKWRITYINKMSMSLLNLKNPYDCIGKTLCSVLPLNEETQRQLQETQRRKQFTSFELPSFTSPGWLAIHAYPAKNGLFLYFRDITEGRHAKEMWRRREQEVQILEESIPDIIIRLNRSLRILYANPPVEGIFGISAGHCIGKTLAELALPEKCTAFYQEHARQVFADGHALTLEVDCTHHSGTHIYQVQFLPELETNGQVDTLLTIGRDITDRKVLEKEMARFDQLNLIGELAASIGHEVRNPMTTIRGFLQMLRKKNGDCSQFKEYFDIMIDELDRANSIITEFLSLAKDKIVNMQISNLNAIISTLYPLLNAEAMFEGKMIQLDLGDIPPLLLDPKEIRQMILNITRNGLEAMTANGSITIRTFQDQNEVILSIQDQGTGIPANILDKIDKPFFTTKERGTGLGLPVCYRIAAHHNAYICIDTSQYGTTFLTHFPLPTPAVDPDSSV